MYVYAVVLKTNGLFNVMVRKCLNADINEKAI